MARTKKRYVACKTSDIPVGECKILNIDGKAIGVFNIKEEFYALLNYCPHTGAELCRGPITGTALPVDDYNYVYGYEGELVRCAWHGWEFKIATGEYLLNPKIKAKSYRVTIENDDDVVVHL